MGKPLGIDFSWIWVHFGNQAGKQNRPRSLKNGIEKTMKKRRYKMASGTFLWGSGGGLRRFYGGISGP